MASLKPKPVRASRTQLADYMNPKDANNYGSVFGGVVLQMVDKAAAVCAMRHAGRHCVTVAMERVEFLVPIRLGQLLIVEAQVNLVGKSSLEIGVEVYAEELKRRVRQHTNSCLVTMVALDDRGRPARVPGLILETPGEKSRYEAALARRKARLAKRATASP